MMKYVLLGKSGLRVSEISLGCMTFGTEWGYGNDREGSFELFNAYREQGGNFFDTANRYTEGISEVWLGDFIRASHSRNESVIATKYALYDQNGRINDGGNHRKNLVQSLHASLKRLGTDYVDLLYVHAWDFTIAPEEMMRQLAYLVQDGKVLHIAISDTPAWVVSRCNTIAELRAWPSFSCFQAEYSLITRDVEREILPLCAQDQMPLIAWGPLGGGALTGKYLKPETALGRVPENSKRRSPKSIQIAEKVVQISEEMNVKPAAVALRWLLQTYTRVIPVVGAKNASQLKESLQACYFSLSDQAMDELNAVSHIDIGWPHDFLTSETVARVLHGGLAQRIDLPVLKQK